MLSLIFLNLQLNQENMVGSSCIYHLDNLLLASEMDALSIT